MSILKRHASASHACIELLPLMHEDGYQLRQHFQMAGPTCDVCKALVGTAETGGSILVEVEATGGAD